LPHRDLSIDFAKGAAVLAVIVMHAMPGPYPLHISGAGLHLAQAVPIFLLLAGYLSYRAWSRSKVNLRQSFSPATLKRYWRRIGLPFAIVLAAQAAALIWVYHIPPREVLVSFLTSGGWGPGSYFPWLYIQCLAILPFLNFLADDRRLSVGAKLALVFFLCMALEWVCVLAMVPTKVYSLLCVRYMFAVFLGVLWGAGQLRLGSPPMVGLAAIGVAFIVVDRYIVGVFTPVSFRSWPGVHAPAFGWTAMCVLGLLKLYSGLARRWRRVAGAVCLLGQASYHVFLFQMVLFFLGLRGFLFRGFVTRLPTRLSADVAAVLGSLVACCIGGLLFYGADRLVAARASIFRRRPA